jgi:hypothetical protein
MLKLFILLALIAIVAFVIKNLTDQPLTQHLKNKDNKDQREHERIQAEKERAFWLEKNKIKNKEKRDEFTRLFVVDYVKTSPLISEGQRAYVVKRLVDEMHDTDNSVIEGNLGETIKRITDESPFKG